MKSRLILENHTENLTGSGYFRTVFAGASFFRVLSVIVFLFSSGALMNAIAVENSRVYVRAGTGIAWSMNSVFSDVDCTSVSPAALFGCITGNDGRPIGAYGDFGNAATVDLGIGYVWSNWLDTELFLSYHPRFHFDGASNFSQLPPTVHQKVGGNVESVSVMVAGVFRPLPLFYGEFRPLDPFVTVGVGMVQNSVDPMVYIFPDTETVTPRGTCTGFAWNVGCGVRYALGRNVKFEILYRYVDLGQVETHVGIMNILDHSTGAVLNNSIIINGTKADLAVHETLLGLVWSF